MKFSITIDGHGCKLIDDALAYQADEVVAGRGGKLLCVEQMGQTHKRRYQIAGYAADDVLMALKATGFRAEWTPGSWFRSGY